MSRPAHRKPPGWSNRTGHSMLAMTCAAVASLFWAACATGALTTTEQPTAAASHVYARPLDDVLMQTKEVLAQKGWRVRRSGDELLTNWLAVEKPGPSSNDAPVAPIATSAPKPADVVRYRVLGERVDAGYCTIQVVRIVATPSNLYFGEKKGGHQVALASGGPNPTPVHHGSSYAFENSDVFQIEAFQEELPSDSTIRTDAPSGMVVNHYERDTALELALQAVIEPPIASSASEADALAFARPQEALGDAGVFALGQSATPVRSVDGQPSSAAAKTPAAERRPTTFAGIWKGIFTFRGNVTGSYAGEIAVALDGDSAQIDDFCPEGGGTLSATASRDIAAWHGKLPCPAISVKGCSAVVLTFNAATATLNDSTLTLVASGSVVTPTGCAYSGGDVSVTFIGDKADYVHLSVTRTAQRTACVWPSDWEDLASIGSMAMPEPPLDDSAYLGIIRAKGDRRTEIQRLLRHCRHLVLLHGQPVLMRVAGTTPATR
jgi:hypothetical protein